MVIHSQKEREYVCLPQTARVKSREDTWIELEDRGRTCYSILGAQESVGTAGKLVTGTLHQRRVITKSFGVGSLRLGERMGSFSHHDPVAAMWGEITAMGRAEIRKAFQDQLTNKARLKGLCGGGCRAASGKAKLVPPPRKWSHFSRV